MTFKLVNTERMIHFKKICELLNSTKTMSSHTCRLYINDNPLTFKMGVKLKSPLHKFVAKHSLNILVGAKNQLFNNNKIYSSFLSCTNQKRWYAQKLQSTANHVPGVSSKLYSNIQTDTIKTFVENKSTSNYDEWMELKKEILSVKGGQLRDENIDGIILAHCVSKLELTKSFIKFLNQKQKKITAQQMSQLFRSFYLNRSECTAEDKMFIKKMYTHIVNQKNVTLAPSSVEGLVSGISITDDWKQGLTLLSNNRDSRTKQLSPAFPLIEAAILNDDMECALPYLDKCLAFDTTNLSENIIGFWIRHISSKVKMHEFLAYLQDNEFVMSKPSADLLVEQCRKHSLYECTHASIHSQSRQCDVCSFPLDRLSLDPSEFDSLKRNFLDRALVGGDVFQKSTPQELDKFLSFLRTTSPYDIVMDGLNISHLGGVGYRRQPDTLSRVINHFLSRGDRILLLGRVHMLRWPKPVVSLIQTKTQYFFVDNLSQDDPYMLYATMQGGMRTRFVSRDLMRSHLFLLKDAELRQSFLKWQQLNQVVILSVNKGQVVIRPQLGYQQRVHCGVNPDTRPTSSTNGVNLDRAGKSWHVPYRDDSIELTFHNVYTPKSTWLCMKETSVR
uniref:Mitochondrial ribonuclease P protein 3 n=2 Tax=Cacopsylla melanoneura TaxID=428564 RepID=A0A8D8VMF5_9HEMI